MSTRDMNTKQSTDNSGKKMLKSYSTASLDGVFPKKKAKKAM